MEGRNTHFELQPVLHSTLPDIAAFLHRWDGTESESSPTPARAHESVGSIERRLKWLLCHHPLIASDSIVGYCLRDSLGVVRGVNLCFPAAFLLADQRLLGLCSGTFFVEAAARSTGFYLFKKCQKIPGYSFQFASSCNRYSSDFWKIIGASSVPNSDTEYLLPLRLDMVIAAYVAYKTSSRAAARVARLCGRSGNPILRLLTRTSAKFATEPCQDWEKLSALSCRHRCPNHITSDCSPEFLQWRYGPDSPAHPCAIYLFSDERGNEGWFALGYLNRGKEWPLRTAVLLDAIWPRDRGDYKDVFEEILRVTAATADAISFRWRPGLDYSSYHCCMISRRLCAPRAFVNVPKGAGRFALDSFDYDDSDYIAWGFQWNEECDMKGLPSNNRHFKKFENTLSISSR